MKRLIPIFSIVFILSASTALSIGIGYLQKDICVSPHAGEIQYPVWVSTSEGRVKFCDGDTLKERNPKVVYEYTFSDTLETNDVWVGDNPVKVVQAIDVPPEPGLYKPKFDVSVSGTGNFKVSSVVSHTLNMNVSNSCGDTYQYSGSPPGIYGSNKDVDVIDKCSYKCSSAKCIPEPTDGDKEGSNGGGGSGGGGYNNGTGDNETENNETGEDSVNQTQNQTDEDGITVVTPSLSSLWNQTKGVENRTSEFKELARETGYTSQNITNFLSSVEEKKESKEDNGAITTTYVIVLVIVIIIFVVALYYYKSRSKVEL